MTITLKEFRTVATKDYLDKIGGADLFCRAVVGKSYAFQKVNHLNEKEEDSPLLATVHNGVRSMTWFLNNMLQNVIEQESNTSLLDNIRDGKLATKFTVKDFEASTDRFGAPLYSMRVFDFAKIREHFPAEYNILIDRDADYTERMLANTKVRENAEKLFLNRYLKDGKLTEAAADEFRLGVLKVEVTEWADDAA